MNLEEMKRAYERDGFVPGGRVISPEEAASLGDELDCTIRARFGEGDTSLPQPAFARDLTKAEGDHLYQMNNMFEVSDAFRRLVSNQTLVERAAFVAGSRTLQVWVEQSMSKPARNGAYFRWHQDGAYHAAAVDPCTRFIAAWVALDDADVDSGCMWMVPGSHRWGIQESHLFRWRTAKTLDDFLNVTPPKNRPSAAAEWRPPVACPVRAGEVHFHHPFTWHGSPANRSDRQRRAVAIHYMIDGARLGEEGSQRVPLEPGSLMLDASSSQFPVVYPPGGV